MLMILLITTIFMFYWLIHPLSLGLILLIQTTIVTMLVGLNSPSFWMSYILFLVFMGGVLVLVMYVITIANNELTMMNLSNFLILVILSSALSTLLYLYFLPTSQLMVSDFKFMKIKSEISMKMLTSIYTFPNFIMVLFLGIYLFYMLIIISNIVNITEGPMRSSN
uniref:NADH-ubiquinone oxidoreductase chain 6 n=1 Tax=Euborellia annulipes TaxID=146833 RepID=A0A343YVG4_9NEOP|nr:NADH dehydrogenase subunit 6 [Euborellia annulipes]